MTTCPGPHDEERETTRLIDGLCPGHYRQRRLGQPLTPLRPYTKGRGRCTFPDCGRTVKGNGLCDPHRKQQRKGQELRPIKTERVGRTIASGGYVKVWDPDHPNAHCNGWVFEHTKVMSEILGRPLWPDENTHHKNAVRDDNRPENLELWTRSQPSGARVEDKLAWAESFLRQYRPELFR